MFPRRRARRQTCGTHRATSPRAVVAATAGRPAKSRLTTAHTMMRKWRRRETGDAMIRPQMPVSATRLRRSVSGPGHSLAAAAMERCPLLLQVVPGVSSLPCLCSSTASSQQRPTPAAAQDATTWRLTSATAQSPNLPAMLGEAPGQTRADPAIPRPTSSIPSARGNIPGVALMRPVMRASAPSPSEPAKQRLARPGLMSAWVSKQCRRSLAMHAWFRRQLKDHSRSPRAKVLVLLPRLFLGLLRAGEWSRVRLPLQLVLLSFRGMLIRTIRWSHLPSRHERVRGTAGQTWNVSACW